MAEGKTLRALLVASAIFCGCTTIDSPQQVIVYAEKISLNPGQVVKYNPQNQTFQDVTPEYEEGF
jgi:hypothetical protein